MKILTHLTSQLFLGSLQPTQPHPLSSTTHMKQIENPKQQQDFHPNPKQ